MPGSCLFSRRAAAPGSWQPRDLPWVLLHSALEARDESPNISSRRTNPSSLFIPPAALCFTSEQEIMQIPITPGIFEELGEHFTLQRRNGGC